MYFPMFLQGVGISAAWSGLILTPFTMLMAFMGIPVGFLIGRTKGYKLLSSWDFSSLPFKCSEPVLLPRASRLSGVCSAGWSRSWPGTNREHRHHTECTSDSAAARRSSFCFLLGVAISPASLGSAMNATYAKSLKLPAALEQAADQEIMEHVYNPNALLSETKMAELKDLFEKGGAPATISFTKPSMLCAIQWRPA